MTRHKIKAVFAVGACWLWALPCHSMQQRSCGKIPVEINVREGLPAPMALDGTLHDGNKLMYRVIQGSELSIFFKLFDTSYQEQVTKIVEVQSVKSVKIKTTQGVREFPEFYTILYCNQILMIRHYAFKNLQPCNLSASLQAQLAHLEPPVAEPLWQSAGCYNLEFRVFKDATQIQHVIAKHNKYHENPFNVPADTLVEIVSKGKSGHGYPLIRVVLVYADGLLRAHSIEGGPYNRLHMQCVWQVNESFKPYKQDFESAYAGHMHLFDRNAKSEGK